MSTNLPDFSEIISRSSDGYFRLHFDQGLIYASPSLYLFVDNLPQAAADPMAALAELAASDHGKDELMSMLKQLRAEDVGEIGAVVELRGGQGRNLWAEVFLVAHRDRQNKVVGVDGIIRDVSEHLMVADLLSRRSVEQSALLEAQRSLLENMDFEISGQTIVELAQKLLQAKRALLFVVDPLTGGRQLKAAAMGAEGDEELAGLLGDAQLAEWMAAQTGPASLDTLGHAELGRSLSTQTQRKTSLLYAPLMIAESVVGGMLALGRAQQYETDDLRFLQALSQVASMALANSRAFETVEHQARIDGLTGAYNRRFLRDTLRAEMVRAEQINHSLAIMMIDVDHLKRINDEHGHLVGDELLTRTVDAIKSLIRDTDWVARYGGDEFVVVLPGGTQQQLERMADKLLQAVEVETPSGAIKAGFSMGGAVLPGGEWIEPEVLLKAADDAEREVKRTGEKQLVVIEVHQRPETEAAV